MMLSSSSKNKQVHSSKSNVKVLDQLCRLWNLLKAFPVNGNGTLRTRLMSNRCKEWLIPKLLLLQRGRPEFNYYKQPGRESVPPYSSPPDYAPRLVKTLPYDSPRDHPVKYTDYQPFRSRGYDYQPSPRGYEYPAAPRAYYPKY